MTHRLLLTAILVPVALLSGGCGTIVNLVRPNKPDKVYGGVRVDFEQISKLVNDEPVGVTPLAHPGAGGGSVAAVLFLVGPFVDIPLSLIGDTLTLPLARWLERRQEAPAPDR